MAASADHRSPYPCARIRVGDRRTACSRAPTKIVRCDRSCRFVCVNMVCVRTNCVKQSRSSELPAAPGARGLSLRYSKFCQSGRREIDEPPRHQGTPKYPIFMAARPPPFVCAASVSFQHPRSRDFPQAPFRRTTRASCASLQEENPMSFPIAFDRSPEQFGH
jgi:hypothetical protein